MRSLFGKPKYLLPLLFALYSVAHAATGEELLKEAMRAEEELRAKDSLFKSKPDFSSVITLYSNALSAGDLSRPDTARALLNRGGLHAAQGNCDAAVQDLNEVIKLEPKQTKAYAMRAYCRRQAGSLSQALEDYNRAVALAPRDPVVLRQRAQLHTALNDAENAVRDYTRSIDLLKPTESSDMLVERGDAYQLQGNYERAIADYQRALQIVKKNAARVSPSSSPDEVSQLRPIFSRLGDAYHAWAKVKK